MKRDRGRWVWAACLILWAPIGGAEEALLAVASNFTGTARELVADFAADGGHRLQISSGSTGVLYAQVGNGAPFDIFLAANDSEPARLVKEGRAVAPSFTYAIGRLVVWSADAELIRGDCAEVLARLDARHVSLANPRLAPYGAAAMAALTRLGLRERYAPRLVMGENVAQAFQYIATGNAAFGFVARAQLVGLPAARAGSYCEVDPALHPPILQQAVLLKRGVGKPAAEGFVKYLRGPRAATIIRRAGYDLP